MTVYSRGDVVLVPFPFTDLSDTKRRPALVISTDHYNRSCPDVIVAQITSRVAAPPRPGDHRVELWEEAGLLAPSLVRARVTTLLQSIVLRRLGTLSVSDLAGVDEGLRQALEL